jgi:hypothetical protein
METNYIFIIIISILSFICLIVFFYECIPQVIDCIVLHKKLKRYNTRIHAISECNDINMEETNTGIELNELKLNVDNVDNVGNVDNVDNLDNVEKKMERESQIESYKSGKEIVL